MSHVFAIRDHLLHELEHGAASAQRLIGRIAPDQWSYRPRENMRSLLELTQHLAMLPATDLAILQEKQGPEFERIEGDIRAVEDPSELAGLLGASVESLRGYFLSLNEDDFLHRSTKPFYAEHGSVQVKWLIEVVTHLFHHRAQLFNYLKQLDHDVTMFDLY